MNRSMLAIIKKDFHGISTNKRLFSTLFIVPIIFTVVMPTIFILTIRFAPGEELGDLQTMLAAMPASLLQSTPELTLLSLLFNQMMPAFFLMIPIMSASITAASSFVGEKEKHTLETLLYCPLTVRQIFQSKVLASFTLSMLVSFASFLLMILVLELELYFFMGMLIAPSISWLIMMLLVSPSFSLLAICLIVRGSAKAKTMEESQQSAVFLIMPVLILILGQSSGLLFISAWLLLGLGLISTFATWLLLKKVMGNYSYETLLK